MLTSVQQPFVTVPSSNIACQKTAAAVNYVLNGIDRQNFGYAGYDSSDISPEPNKKMKKHSHLMG